MHPRGALVTALAAVLTATMATPVAAQPAPLVVPDPAAHVDPLIGTTNLGNTFPGAVLPFGMFSFSPEGTRGNTLRAAAPGGYRHDATRLRGFSLTHMSGTGCAGGSGDVPLFPHVGEVATSPASDATDALYASDFAHADETAKPGRYDVRLKSGAQVELTATTRTGAGRFTFPAGKPATVLVNTAKSQVGSSDASTTVDAAERTVTGSVTSGNFCGYLNQAGRRSYYTLHFALEFDRPFTSVGTWTDAAVTPGSTSARGGTTYGTNGWPVLGKGSGAYLGFEPGSTVGVRVGISYVSQDGAVRNLRAENTGRPFEDLRDDAYRAWQDQLRKIEVGGGSDADRTKFYTALYHSLLHPNVFSDVDGRYAGFDGEAREVSGRQRAQYATFSGWDVYRSQVQLLTLLEPDIGSDIAQSLLNQAEQNGGVWDRWTHASGGTHVMSGDPSAQALAGILAFGGERFDVRAATKSLVKAATTPTALDLSKEGWAVMSVGQRPSLDKYLRLGYMPSVSNAWGGAAETLEVSGADFALSQLAERTGDRATARRFAERAQWWQNNYDPVAHSTGGYVRNRDESGEWAPGFTPDTGTGFVEGSSAQYTWMVPHNVAGLVESLGGAERVNRRLDDFFHDADGSWALSKHGGAKSELDNEPSLNVPWLYNYTGRPAKTQETVREVVNTLWTTGPGGIPGNDDLGAMSSWFVFAALGLYPQVPSRAELVLSAPLFTSVVVHRDGGRDIRITAPGASAQTKYVRALKVDGRASTRTWVDDSLVRRGGKLDFTLSTTPTSWGTGAGDAPPSFRRGEKPIRHDQPFHFAVEPGSPVVQPGGTLAVTIVKTRLYDGDPKVRYEVSGPPGLEFGPVTGSDPAEFTVTAAPDAAQGFHPASVTVLVAGAEPVELPLVVKVAPEDSMLAAVDNAGISDDATGAADFDGGGYSYSRQALAAAGLVAGGTGSVDGLAFAWPDSPAGLPDNAVADGQRITAEGTRLAFVGSATNGQRAEDAVVEFTDGSTATTQLGFSDWTLGGGGSAPAYGNVVVATTPYRNQSGGGKESVATHIFATRTYTAPEGKRIAAVVLPVDDGLHVFAVATG
ncbi:GH92 family glycosyl hydrolase [Actinosynnema mirum]|uniref:Alpha-1,2-mannosidase n=1 Tax=Actinosynnema mirum (strain ATCC 29888 / DSM 43827 / JCM 3225 / NBRC 14064 / NCIMB 13271 / NRRL B-12336 / IMRU 3971 / 101) TaxID=446462 RepID=C6WEC8_ACTMD|nr:GH92 family glycosyl hydrolase [Actinosynnema mirum]ACU37728.1 alpha-1,2-mannosidase [Actinosynnema mirum DSM 43827]